jgi:hypothetical protein
MIFKKYPKIIFTFLKIFTILSLPRIGQSSTPVLILGFYFCGDSGEVRSWKPRVAAKNTTHTSKSGANSTSISRVRGALMASLFCIYH